MSSVFSVSATLHQMMYFLNNSTRLGGVIDLHSEATYRPKNTVVMTYLYINLQKREIVCLYVGCESFFYPSQVSLQACMRLFRPAAGLQTARGWCSAAPAETGRYDRKLPL